MDIKITRSKKSKDEENISENANDNIGTSEYYEDLAVPKEQPEQIQEEKREKIKLEPVSKDEIYRNKLEKEKAFVAKFKKSEESENESINPTSVTENTSRKSSTFIIIGAFFVAGMLSAAYFYFLRNPKTPTINEVPAGMETSVESADQAVSQETTQAANNENVPVVEEKEIMPSEISVKVLNEGAIAGSAAKVKGILTGKGYTKTEAGNGEKENLSGTTVYYKEEKFKKLAETVSKILSANKIKSEIMLAVSTEEKSADIVVILGK